MTAAPTSALRPGAAGVPGAGADGREPGRRPRLTWDRALRPGPLIAVGALASFVAWSVPGAGLDRGYVTRAPVTLGGLLLLVVWYLASCVAATVGHMVGGRVRPARSLDDVDVHRMETALTVVGAIGVVYSYVLVASRASVAAALNAHLGNELSSVIPDQPGLQTLRYATPVATALVVHGFVTRERRRTLLATNVVLLAATALLASRLSLVLTGVLVLFLFRDRIPLRPGRTLLTVGLAAVCAFFATMPFNYVRNANYYEARDIYGAVDMNTSQVVTYLGAPTQVALGQANALYADDPATQKASLYAAVLPTYVPAGPASTSSGGRRYAASVDVSRSLTTNSVFADNLAQGGVAGLLSTLLAAGLAGALVGHFRQYRGPTSVAAGILLYGFAEWWRTFVFNDGFLHFGVLLVVVTALLVGRRR